MKYSSSTELDIQKRMCCRSGTRPAMGKLAREMGSWLPRQRTQSYSWTVPREAGCSTWHMRTSQWDTVWDTTNPTEARLGRGYTDKPWDTTGRKHMPSTRHRKDRQGPQPLAKGSRRLFSHLPSGTGVTKEGARRRACANVCVPREGAAPARGTRSRSVRVLFTLT